MMSEQVTLMAACLGGDAGAWERPPPYAEDFDAAPGPHWRGSDPIHCLNTHFFLLEKA
jgi:hypothetical protein